MFTELWCAVSTEDVHSEQHPFTQLPPVEGNSSTKDSGSVGNGSAVKEPKQQKAKKLGGRGPLSILLSAFTHGML